MIRLVRIVAWLAAWLAGGVLICRWVISQPVEMPELLDRSIRVGLGWIGRNDLANPDDMEVIAFLLILAASFAISALVVAAGRFALALAVRGANRAVR